MTAKPHSQDAPPTDSLSFLGDLAAEAKAERAALGAVLDERADAAARARRQEEAIRREALQAELVKETRRLQSTRLLTMPAVESERPAAETAGAPAELEAEAGAGSRRGWLVAAGLVALLAGGGAVFAVTQAQTGGIAVDGLAGRASQVGQTVVAASMAAEAAAGAEAEAEAEAGAGAEAEAGAGAEAEAEAGAGAGAEAGAGAGAEAGAGAGAEAGAGAVVAPKKPRGPRATAPRATTPRAGVIGVDLDKIYGGGTKKK
jgi:hypothetical protein